MEHKSTICLLEGDQVKCWVQKLTVIRSGISLEEAKLLFEFHNLAAGEMQRAANDDMEVSYSGLYGLEEEIWESRRLLKAAAGALTLPAQDREQVTAADLLALNPQRYAPIRKYLGEDPADFDLENMDFQVIGSARTYYWIDLTRVSQAQYERYTGELHHVYNVAELFGPELPFDPEDPEVVSVFGTGKFEALADFSYGC